jgi:alpha-ribazole phosphatase
MLELILVRHGETEWNKNEIFRGRADIALNETGLKQAELAGKYLSAEKINIIYSSPLKRALKTAQAIARYQKLRVHKTDCLNDFDFGEWQGLTLEEVKERDDVLYQDWLDTPEQMRVPGGESLESVNQRVMPFLEDAMTRCREGKIVLVSHRVVLKITICALLGLDNSHFWNIKMDTGAITRFQIEKKRTILISHNETSYLKTLEVARLADF